MQQTPVEIAFAVNMAYQPTAKAGRNQRQTKILINQGRKKDIPSSDNLCRPDSWFRPNEKSAALRIESRLQAAQPSTERPVCLTDRWVDPSGMGAKAPKDFLQAGNAA